MYKYFIFILFLKNIIEVYINLDLAKWLNLNFFKGIYFFVTYNK